MEIWKDVEGFPGYTVSDLGRARGLRGGILKPLLLNDYHHYSLYVDKKKIDIRVNRLVAFAFIGPCPVGKEVDHKNNNPLDNRLVNLQYMTHSENIRKRPKFTGCASRYIGVRKDGNRWRGTASAEKRVYLGPFKTEEEAARARDKFYRDRGQLVTFNFPE